jgi:tripartite-type tricarboxylate transporter receptor subunit TctC
VTRCSHGAARVLSCRRHGVARAEGEARGRSCNFARRAAFTPLEWFVEQPIVPITRAELPADTPRQFRAYATVNHPRMQFGSSGLGLGSHFSCARLNAALGIVPTHFPYRGSAAAMQNLIAGRIDYFCATAMGPLEAGSAKAIAVLTSERSHLFPVGWR